MARTKVVRLDTELVTDAAEAGARVGRSTADQINHWVRLGMEYEASPTVTHRAILDLLSRRERDR